MTVVSPVRNGESNTVAGWTAAVIATLLLTSDSPGQQNVVLSRTRIDGHTICGLSGSALHLDPNSEPPIRAWAGILQVPGGGSSREFILHRHKAWLRIHLRIPIDLPSNTSPAALNAELDARRRHLEKLQPQYFDAVLLQRRGGQNSQLRWIVDFDIDGSLADESCRLVSVSTVELRSMITVRSTGGTIKLAAVQPEQRTASDSKGGTALAPRASGQSLSHQTSDYPEQLRSLRDALHALDTIQTRKQHLDQVVDAADQLITAIDHRNDLTLNLELADALYRKGRALGYMELPDVVAVRPIDDQKKLNALFEDTFQRLEKLVDTTDPKYILLKIRYERRRGFRGSALDLVETYRQRHSAPIWHYKKRLDLFTELGARFCAHQAACDMWLHATKPDRPVSVIVRRSSDLKDSTVTGSWHPKPPFRQTALTFQSLSNAVGESVVWLDPEKSYSLSDPLNDANPVMSFVARTGQIVNLDDDPDIQKR